MKRLGILGWVALGLLLELCACAKGDAMGPGDGGGIPGIPAIYGLDERPSNPTCLAPDRPPATGTIQVQRVFSPLSFSQPVLMLQAPGDSSKFYVIEQAGMVLSFDNTPSVSTTAVFADLTAMVKSTSGELGLLGMAFHPDYATNRYVFMSYTRANGSETQSVVDRYTVVSDRSSVDMATRKEILVLDQPFDNHNGGNIAFGPPEPKRFLYVGFGDGGSGGDPDNRAQNVEVLLGKMLRIDVDVTSGAYGIPSDNPFATSGGKPEIYAVGFRNPWRWSFDLVSNELWVGDVGQGENEEVDKVVRGGNYGWNVKEGTACYNATTCSSAGLIDPVVEYTHDFGISITGGYVYRGSAISFLAGRFVYADFGSGRVWAVQTDPLSGQYSAELLLDSGISVSSFAQDNSNELYIVDYGGPIHKILPVGPAPASTFPTLLSQTGCVDPANPKKLAAGVIPYTVNMSLWSDGAAKERGLAIPDGEHLSIDAESGDWDFPNRTVLVKTFYLGGKRIETRLFMRHDDGNWAGYTYEWRDDESDAELLMSSKTKAVNGTSWHFPSRAECLQCHTQAAGRSLGLETAQLNGNYTYVSTGKWSNQLDTLGHIGMFTEAPATAATLPALAALESSTGSIESKARAYLHVNCSGCHRPGGTGGGNADLRAFSGLEQMNVCNVAPEHGSLGVSGAALLVPGQAAKSLMSIRPHRLDAYRMPPIATKVVDVVGLSMVDAWINSVTACP